MTLSVMPMELPAACAAAPAPRAAVHPPQKGALGGRQAVDALFGLNTLAEAEDEGEQEEEDDAAAWPPCCCTSDEEDGEDERSGMHIDSLACEEAAVPRSPGANRQNRHADGVVPEVEQLLWGSLDGVLFEADDGHFLRRCETSFASLCTACGDGGSSACSPEDDARCMACDDEDEEEHAEHARLLRARCQPQSHSPTSVLPEPPSPFGLAAPAWPAKLLAPWEAQQQHQHHQRAAAM